MLDFPKRVTLELTNRCNLKCVFCPRRLMESERGDMAVSLAVKALEEMAAHTPTALVPFFRGESLLHPNWADILEKARSLGLKPIQLASNASLLTEERARILLDLQIDFLSFSMDTLDPDEYKKLRGADYGESLGNVLRFLSLRSKRGRGPRVQVSAVKPEEASEKTAAFVDYWLPKVDRVRVYREHSGDGEPGSLKTPPLPRRERRICHKVLEETAIYWNGDFALCNHDWTRRVTGQRIGNLASESIRDVWHGTRYAAIRAAHTSGNLAGVEPCLNCDHWAVSYIPEGYWGRAFEK